MKTYTVVTIDGSRTVLKGSKLSHDSDKRSVALLGEDGKLVAVINLDGIQIITEGELVLGGGMLKRGD